MSTVTTLLDASGELVFTTCPECGDEPCYYHHKMMMGLIEPAPTRNTPPHPVRVVVNDDIVWQDKGVKLELE